VSIYNISLDVDFVSVKWGVFPGIKTKNCHKEQNWIIQFPTFENFQHDKFKKMILCVKCKQTVAMLDIKGNSAGTAIGIKFRVS
jgi:hypothetical protein